MHFFFFCNNPKIKRILLSSAIIIYYVLCNKFSYTQLTSAFIFQEGFYYIHNDTESSLLFLL